jgi:hypothetical protein
LYTDFPGLEGFKRVRGDVEFLDEVQPGTTIYTVVLGGFLNGSYFYFGTLTDLPRNTGRRGSHVREDSPGLVFTRFGTDSVFDLRAEGDGHWLASDHEGQHVSVRYAYRALKGRFTFTLEQTDRDEVGVWVTAAVRDHAAGRTVTVGSLRFPGRELRFDRSQLGAFVEYYGWKDGKGGLMPFGQIPAVRAVVGNWEADGRPLVPTGVRAVHPKRVPQRGKAFMAGVAPDAAVAGHSAEMARPLNVVLTTRPDDQRRDTRWYSTVRHPDGSESWCETLYPYPIGDSPKPVPAWKR